MNELRFRLVEVALQWESAFGNAPSVTCALSEFDAANIVGCSIQNYSACMQGGTAVQKGYDFLFEGRKYQVKGNRPSGKPGCKVTLVSKAKNYDWHFLIWILYDREYRIKEAWQWDVDAYKKAFHDQKYTRPADLRKGEILFSSNDERPI